MDMEFLLTGRVNYGVLFQTKTKNVLNREFINTVGLVDVMWA